MRKLNERGGLGGPTQRQVPFLFGKSVHHVNFRLRRKRVPFVLLFPKRRKNTVYFVVKCTVNFHVLLPFREQPPPVRVQRPRILLARPANGEVRRVLRPLVARQKLISLEKNRPALHSLMRASRLEASTCVSIGLPPKMKAQIWWTGVFLPVFMFLFWRETFSVIYPYF